MKLGLVMGRRGHIELGVVLVVIGVIFVVGYIVGGEGNNPIGLAVGVLLMIWGTGKINRARKTKNGLKDS